MGSPLLLVNPFYVSEYVVWRITEQSRIMVEMRAAIAVKTRVEKRCKSKLGANFVTRQRGLHQLSCRCSRVKMGSIIFCTRRGSLCRRSNSMLTGLCIAIPAYVC